MVFVIFFLWYETPGSESEFVGSVDRVSRKFELMLASRWLKGAEKASVLLCRCDAGPGADSECGWKQNCSAELG